MPHKTDRLLQGERSELDRRRAEAREWARRLPDPTEDEDAAIVAGALSDPDTPPSTEEQLAAMRPAHEVHPELVAQHLRRGRGRPKIERPKVKHSIRIDADVLDHFRATGPGWQSRINEALRKAAGK
jgi:uncharacterized protein (DUF4415 family)